MSTQKANNISISEFESFLELCQCKFIKNDNGHVKYSRSDLFRPIIFQNHIDPIPQFIVLNNLRLLGISKKEYFEIMDCKKEVKKINNVYKLMSCK